MSSSSKRSFDVSDAIDRVLRTGSRLVFGLIVVALPLLLGGASPKVIVATTGLLLLCAAAVAIRGDLHRGVTRSLVIIGCLAAVIATVLQLVPVPLLLVKLGSPGAYEVLTIREPGYLHAFTLDPPATAIALVKMVGILAASVVGFTVYRRRPRELLAVVTAAGVIAVIVGFVHLALGWRLAYDRYGIANAEFVTSFVNPNHFAGFCGFCAFVALGLAMDLQDERRWLPLGAAGLCVAGVVLSLSRGGIIALTVACLFLAVLVSGHAKRSRTLWALSVPAVVAIAVFLAVSRSSVMHEMATVARAHGDVRVTIWKAAVAALPRFWLFGMGSGAFGLAFARYQPAADVTFTHTENQLLQCLMDWGIVPGLVVVGLAGLYLMRATRQSENQPFAPSLCAAFVFTAVHNLVDFNLWLMAVSVPAVACAAMLESRRDGRRRTRDDVVTVRLGRRLIAVCVGVAVVASVAVAGWFGVTHDVRKDVSTLRAATAKADTHEARMRALDICVAHHPADFLSRIIVAERELAEPNGASAALKLINEAMFVAPSYSATHRLAGRALFALKAPAQALLEYRLAIAVAPQISYAIVDEVDEVSPALIPQLAGDNPDERMQIAARALAHGRIDQVEILLSVPELANNARALELLTRNALAAQRWQQAIARARLLQSAQPGVPWPYEAEAAAYRGQGRGDLALATLQRAVDITASAASVLTMLAEVLVERGDLAHATEVTNRLITRTSTTTAAADAHWLLATIFERQGRTSEAIGEYERARDRAPKLPRAYLKLAELHSHEGNLGLAHHELERGLVATGGAPELRQALAAARN